MTGYIGADGESHNSIKFFAQGQGLIDLPISAGDEIDAQFVGRYFKLVGEYLHGFNDGSAIQNYEGYTFRGYPIETDLNTIYYFASAGELSFPELYDN